MMKKLLIELSTIIIAIIIIIAFLLHPAYSPFAEFHDTDADGYSDSIDEYPNDSTEWKDTDLDSYPDNSDDFPNDKTEWIDTDNDSYGDNSDVFPNNPLEWLDTDNDGYGNNNDTFPEDDTEWSDLDNDGIGDNDDFYNAGNGKIIIRITLYLCDLEVDGFNNFSDPYYEISIDENNDGIFDLVNYTKINTNATILRNSSNDYAIFDLSDDTDKISFRIVVYDGDELNKTDNDLIIDYTNDTSSKYYIHDISEPFNGYWEQDGFLDSPLILFSELDCLLNYSVEILKE